MQTNLLVDFLDDLQAQQGIVIDDLFIVRPEAEGENGPEPPSPPTSRQDPQVNQWAFSDPTPAAPIAEAPRELVSHGSRADSTSGREKSGRAPPQSARVHAGGQWVLPCADADPTTRPQQHASLADTHLRQKALHGRTEVNDLTKRQDYKSRRRLHRSRRWSEYDHYGRTEEHQSTFADQTLADGALVSTRQTNSTYCKSHTHVGRGGVVTSRKEEVQRRVHTEEQLYTSPKGKFLSKRLSGSAGDAARSEETDLHSLNTTVVEYDGAGSLVDRTHTSQVIGDRWEQEAGLIERTVEPARASHRQSITTRRERYTDIWEIENVTGVRRFEPGEARTADGIEARADLEHVVQQQGLLGIRQTGTFVERTRPYQRANGQLNYGPVGQVRTHRSTTHHGILVDTSLTEEQVFNSDGTVEQSVELERRLGAAGGQAVTSALRDALDLAWDLALGMPAAETPARLAAALVAAGEGWLVARTQQLLSTGMLGRGVPLALVGLLTSRLAARGLVDFQTDPAQRPSSGGEKALAALGDVARTTVQMLVSMAVPQLALVDLGRLETALADCLLELEKANTLSEKARQLAVVLDRNARQIAGQIVVGTVSAAATGAAVNYLTEQLGVEGDLQQGLSKAAVTAAVGFLVAKLWGVWESRDQQRTELAALRKKYGLAADCGEKEIRQMYRALVKKAHPDKGGSAEAFNELTADVARLSLLSEQHPLLRWLYTNLAAWLQVLPGYATVEQRLALPENPAALLRVFLHTADPPRLVAHLQEQGGSFTTAAGSQLSAQSMLAFLASGAGSGVFLDLVFSQHPTQPHRVYGLPHDAVQDGFRARHEAPPLTAATAVLFLPVLEVDGHCWAVWIDLGARTVYWADSSGEYQAARARQLSCRLSAGIQTNSSLEVATFELHQVQVPRQHAEESLVAIYELWQSLPAEPVPSGGLRELGWDAQLRIDIIRRCF